MPLRPFEPQKSLKIMAGVHAQFATGLRIVGLRVTGAVGPVLVTDGTASLETRGGALV